MSTRYADDSGITHIFDLLKAKFLSKNDAPQPSSGNPLMDGSANKGISRNYAREDHVHPSDTSRASVDSPTFTGTPLAPTAAAGTNTQQIATCGFVANALASAGFQSSLTAGAHIRIQNGVISAYRIGDCDDVQINGNSIVGDGIANITDFQGGTISSAGTAGLVPAPPVWEEDRFLCADGTWKVTSGSGGGGGVNYSKTIQNTGKTWIDGRAIYQITIDLQDYEPISGITGAKWYQIDVSELDIGMVTDVEQVGYIYTQSAYIYTSVNGFVNDNYFVGVSSDGKTLNVYQTEVSGGYKYFMNYITIRFINPKYVEYEWDFTQSLTDKNHSIPFVGTATRDSSGLQLTPTTYATLWRQGTDWTPTGGSGHTDPTDIPKYTRWTLELDIAEASMYDVDPFGSFPSLITFLAGNYCYFGVDGANNYWKFAPCTAVESPHTLSEAGVSYFNGHTLKIKQDDSIVKFYRDDDLIDTVTMTTSEKFYMGNFTSLGGVYIRGANNTVTMGQSLNCLITGCRFKRLSDV